MYMWRGNQQNGQLDHFDTFKEDNLLTHGQTVINVRENETVSIKLKLGQLSLDHPWVVHGSGPKIERTQNRLCNLILHRCRY